MRGLCIVVLTVLQYLPLPAQEINFSFKHLTTDQGLSANQVNAIAQDSQGYIWIGTAHGLQRYDGHRFRNFRYDPDDERAIPANVVEHLHVDRRNRLWVMVREGMAGIFDTRTFTFRGVDVYQGDNKGTRLPEARFLSDTWGNVFIMDKQEGLFRWNEEKGRFYACRFPRPAANDWRVTGFAQRPGTAEYIVNFEAEGLFRFRADRGNWQDDNATLTPLALPAYPEELEAYNLFVDKQDRLWAQFWPPGYHAPKVYCFDLLKNDVRIRDYEPNVLTGIYIETAPFFQSRDGAVWVYGVDMFARYSTASDTFQLVQNGYVNNRSIRYRTIKTLFEDREHSIWVGTNDNGIFSFNPGKEYFRNIDHIDRQSNRRGHGSPTDFIQLADSTILVSYWGNGLYRYDRQWNELPFVITITPNLNPYNIWSMRGSRRKGIIWMSTQPGGILRYDESSGQAEAFRAGILKNNTIRQVVEDDRGDLWLGMQSMGVFHWTCNRAGRLTDTNPSKFQAIPDCRVNKMIVDREGLIWIATDKHGLYVIDPDAGKVVLHLHNQHTDPAYRTADPGISSVLDYNDSLVVLSGLSSVQVFNRNRRTLTRLKKEGEMAGYIADLARDRSGNLWVSTTSGLYRVNLQRDIILKFGRPDGIEDEHFGVASSCALPDGQMLFGASETFVVFDPVVFDQIENARPQATITALQVNNRLAPVESLEEAGGLRLRYYQSALTLEFSTLQFYRSHSIRYKMEGLDPDWQINDNNLAVYSYLPAGSYRFLLQPVYTNGALGPIRSLGITRNPPFWQTWWFYSLLCLTGGGIFFLFDRERMRRRTSVQQMRTKIADQLHAQIRTALNSIHILSEMATIKARKDPAQAASFLSQINDKSQQMLHAMDDILWAVAPENDSMSRVVERIEAYVQHLRSGGYAGIDLLVDQEVSSLVLDMPFRQMLLRLIKASIDGLLRAGARSLQVYMGRDKMQLSYVIEFDKAEADMTILNNLLQAGEMTALSAKMGAAQQMEIHQTKGMLSFNIPV